MNIGEVCEGSLEALVERQPSYPVDIKERKKIITDTADKLKDDLSTEEVKGGVIDLLAQSARFLTACAMDKDLEYNVEEDKETTIME